MSSRSRPPTVLNDGIGHVGLRVSNLEKSKRFYLEILGLVDEASMERGVFMRSGKDSLVLHEKEVGAPDYHFGFHVNSKDRVYQWRDWLMTKGIEVFENMPERDDYRSIKFRDPDGNWIEITYDRRLE